VVVTLYRNKKTGGTHSSGSAQKYETMSLQEIKEFPIHDIIADDGIHFLWVPVPLKFEAVEAVNAWGGFTYKTSIIWKKVDGIGMGFWARGVIEELWILVKGNVKALRWQGKNILEEDDARFPLDDGHSLPLYFPVGFVKAKTGKVHSRKPDRMYDIIEEMVQPFPELNPRVELFATKVRPGWTSVGHILGSDVYEFAKHLKCPFDDIERCSLCGWPLKRSFMEGCIEGNCSARPRPKTTKTIYDPYRARLEGHILKPFEVAA